VGGTQKLGVKGFIPHFLLSEREFKGFSSFPHSEIFYLSFEYLGPV
jgi:hypothetical protein